MAKMSSRSIFPALSWIDTEISHLVPNPPSADTEQKAAAGHHIKASDSLGRDYWLAFDHLADRRPDAQLRRRGRRSRERNERIQRVRVVTRQQAPLGSARRNVRMLSDPERLEAALLDGTSQPRHVHRVFGREDRDPEVHVLPLGAMTATKQWQVNLRLGNALWRMSFPGGKRHS
jgi:hypothetical protein